MEEHWEKGVNSNIRIGGAYLENLALVKQTSDATILTLCNNLSWFGGKTRNRKVFSILTTSGMWHRTVHWRLLYFHDIWLCTKGPAARLQATPDVGLSARVHFSSLVESSFKTGRNNNNELRVSHCTLHTAGLNILCGHKQNQFAARPRGLRQIKNYVQKYLVETHPLVQRKNIFSFLGDYSWIIDKNAQTFFSCTVGCASSKVLSNTEVSGASEVPQSRGKLIF